MNRNKQNDCDIIKNDFEDLFGSFGECFETTLDEKKSKMQVVGSIFGFGKSVAKLGWHGTACVVKHTPKAIVTIANAKHGLTENIASGYQKIQKQINEDKLEEKIRRLKISSRKEEI